MSACTTTHTERADEWTFTDRELSAGAHQSTSVVSVRSPSGYVTRVEDLVCPECNANISFASASMVASCTLCGADLEVLSVEPSEGSVAVGVKASPGAVRGS